MLKKILILSFLTVVVAFPVLASAQALVTCGNPGSPQCTLNDFTAIFTTITTIIMTTVAPGLGIIFLIIGGLQILFSAGNPEMFGAGKKVIIATIIGLVLVYGALAIINFVLGAIGATV